MSKLKFLFSSEQLELLIAFEMTGSLSELSSYVHKDASVVSRNLQRISEIAPVLIKKNRRWELTDLGRSLNIESKKFILSVNEMLEKTKTEKMNNRLLLDNTLLILVNTQKALLDGSNNKKVVLNIEKILNYWRQTNRPMAHVRHASEKPTSLFFTGSKSFEFISELSPQIGEPLFEKTKSSVTTSSSFNLFMNEGNYTSVVLVGFTGNDCIDISARHLAEAGLDVVVVSDATASLDVTGIDGRLHTSDRVHSLTMANIQAQSAQVVQTNVLLQF